MTIQIAQRIGRALNVSSATKIKELDEALRAYVRAVPPGATVPVSGSFDASQVVSGTFANARVAAGNVTQHQAALSIATSQLTGTLPDARVAVTNVTQHQAALSILNSQLPGYTAADVLSKLLTVDGAGSGLDADLLDGSSSAAFAVAPTTGTWTPADNSGAGLAITVTSAHYWKLGSLVLASARVDYPVTVSGASASLSGLPFALNANQSSRQGFVSYSTAAVPVTCLPIHSSQILTFNTGIGAAITNAQLSGAVVIFQTIYQT